jgi:beta-glucanase (GH16 family)
MVAASLTVVVTATTPAVGASSKAPTVSLRQASVDVVAVSGRTATASPKVRFKRYTASGWTFVKRIRAHRHHYRTTLSVAAGTTARFRVTSNHRSRTFRVTMPAAKQPIKYDACGARPRKADGSSWSCTFDDEFNGTSLDRTKWTPQTQFVTGSTEVYACYRDDPANVNVAGGVLNLNLVRLDAPAPCPLGWADTDLMSGGVSSWHLFSQQYGRFEARIKNTATTAPGLHEAFWLWPDNRYSTIDWPTSGEIDIVETYSSAPTLAIPFFHYSADALGMQLGVNTNGCAAARGVWNTYTLEWTASRLEVFVNGKSCLVNTSGDAAFRKRYILTLTQGMGPFDAGNMPNADTPFPASMQVDYVHVWQ